MSEFREYWIAKLDPYDGRVFDKDPRTFESGASHHTVKKVVEYAALEQANEKIEELEAKLNNYMLGFATQTERCESLETKLSIAVDEFKLLEKYKAYNGDDWVSNESKKALEKIRGSK